MDHFPQPNRVAAEPAEIIDQPIHETFQYTRLDDPTAQIRLLRLEPGTGTDIIVCNLSVTDLSQTPSYDALSYAWGDPTPSKSIICNGKLLNIAENLHLALVTFRNGQIIDRLWADAICIDQQDDEEKGHQVALMRHVYSHAVRTLVWLGAPPSPDPFAILNEFIRLWENRGPSDSALELFSRDYFWATLGRILIQKVFERKWCVQELVLSESAQLAWGVWLWPLDDFTRILTLLLSACDREDMKAEFDRVFPGHGLSLAVSLARTGTIFSYQCRSDVRRSSLLELLWRTSSHRTTLIHDSIYAVTGICTLHRGTRLEIIHDYTVGPAEVLFRATQVLMHEILRMAYEEIRMDLFRRLPKFERNIIVPGARQRNVRLKGSVSWLAMYSCYRPGSLVDCDDASGVSRTLLMVYTCLQLLMSNFYLFDHSEPTRWVPVLLQLIPIWCKKYEYEPRKLGIRRHSVGSFPVHMDCTEGLFDETMTEY